VATLPPARCSCGRYLRRRAEGHDDYQAEERAYFHEFEECPCGGDVRVIGAFGPEPERKPRGGGRPASPLAKSRARMHRFLCACDPPVLIRHARTELDAVCGVCSEAFIWSPTPREQGVALVMADA